MRTLLTAALLGLTAHGAAATTTSVVFAVGFEFEIDYEGLNAQSGERTPELGDRVVVEYRVDVEDEDVRFVNETILTDLRFSLFGEGDLLFEDRAIEGGVVRPIGAVPRAIGDVSFLFDTDSVFDGDDLSDVLLEFDNDPNLLADGATGVDFFNIFGDIEEIDVEFISDGVFIEELSTFGDVEAAEDIFVTVSRQVDIDPVAPIPLPAGAWMLLTGLGCLGFRRFF